MLLCTATRASIFGALTFLLTKASTTIFQNDFPTLAPDVGKGYIWSNTFSTPPEETVEVQFDSLVGSVVITLTCNSDSAIVDLTAASNVTPAGTVPSPSPNNISTTGTPSANTTPFRTDSPFVSLSSIFTVDSSSLGPKQSTSLTLPPATTTSTSGGEFPSLFTGIAERSSVSFTTVLIWILLALLPTAAF
ncbi:uncharacterized protein PV07_02623 [Cladophialophora immunda]|uniref:Uncharacterized protein n=1 Tax=Cladophialophora immunda TaxID=569365 RepID=A0A0D2B058_9EURO|nr:uncharacterized protein PV07_02623 [Cladophialophora immunda]KIW30932.1 hypothetical protein PV07_02623 [Cladophialophora immunda]